MYKIDNLQSQTLQNLASRTALGIYTKTHATFENTRLARFALQSQAAKLLPKECKVVFALSDRCINFCWCEIQHKKREKAHYSNLQRCGSVWHCPVCASIITEKRRAEIKKAIDAHDGGLYMLTPYHTPLYGDNLESLLLGFRGL